MFDTIAIFLVVLICAIFLVKKIRSSVNDADTTCACCDGCKNKKKEGCELNDPFIRQ